MSEFENSVHFLAPYFKFALLVVKKTTFYPIKRHRPTKLIPKNKIVNLDHANLKITWHNNRLSLFPQNMTTYSAG